MRNKPVILTVEDDANDQVFIEMAFRSSGVTCPIHIVGDGAEAIAYLRGDGEFCNRTKYPYPTIIMTDLKMPRVNGFQLLEFLKRNPEWAVIPTIVFSASSDLDDIKKSYLMGASSYHIKAQNVSDLRSQLGLLYAYWITAEVPLVDQTGKQMRTDSAGKMGEAIPQPSGGQKPC
jgi:CheY-like chemotaxis protein